MSPIKLLERHLKSMERDLEKSQESFLDAKIGKRIYEIHERNIAPRIIDYQKAIELLKKEFPF